MQQFGVFPLYSPEIVMNTQDLEKSLLIIDKALRSIRATFKDLDFEVNLRDLSTLDAILIDLKKVLGSQEEHEQIDLCSEVLVKLKGVFPVFLDYVKFHEEDSAAVMIEAWQKSIFEEKIEEREEEILALISTIKLAAVLAYAACRSSIVLCEQAIELSPSEEDYSLLFDAIYLLCMELWGHEYLGEVMSKTLGPKKMAKVKAMIEKYHLTVHDDDPELAMELSEDLFESLEDLLDGIILEKKLIKRFQLMSHLTMDIVDLVSSCEA